MTKKTGGFPLLVGALLTGALLVPSLAFGHGEKGEHVEEFREHIDDYEAGVRKLTGQLEALAATYAEGQDVSDKVEGFVDAWKSVKYHAAVEEVATPLYPPIWQAISGLRQAVKKDEGPEAVRKQAARVTAALNQGLGGIKLRANLKDGTDMHSDHGREESEAHGPAASFDRIREHLDHAVSDYAEGNKREAKALIRDAYFNEFEGLEGGLIEQDPELVVQLEEAFNAELPGLINEGAPVDRVRSKVESMKQALMKSEEILKQADQGDSEVF
ncbi:hypothetical protein [Thiohalorhabdus methylotrophus]|uniref:Uncharacterized protein n=1 Tax=Thiohalorhabdus methylotrophus TaxID=3242694 RepID=A0ABV4TYJ4_9GAMM